ncbi:6-phosphogluconolactonase [Denitratisoma sp. agr-D3]
MSSSTLNGTESDGWARFLLEKIAASVAERRGQNGRCSVALTGGRSAERLYRVGAASHDFLARMQNVDFFFGDERCVPPDHADSNYRLVMDTLFASGLPKGAYVHRIEADSANLEEAADRYGSRLPSSIDVLLLSMGEDGHIASIYPRSPAIVESKRRVIPVKGSRPPYLRLTLTPTTIQKAHHVFVLALGPQKRAIYEEALRKPLDVDQIPARLVLSREWTFGPAV